MKQALLAVSFGTSVPRARQDIEAVERVLAAGAPERVRLTNVVFPTPVGPTTAINSPGLTEMQISSRTEPERCAPG